MHGINLTYLFRFTHILSINYKWFRNPSKHDLNKTSWSFDVKLAIFSNGDKPTAIVAFGKCNSRQKCTSQSSLFRNNRPYKIVRIVKFKFLKNKLTMQYNFNIKFLFNRNRVRLESRTDIQTEEVQRHPSHYVDWAAEYHASWTKTKLYIAWTLQEKWGDNKY